MEAARVSTARRAAERLLDEARADRLDPNVTGALARAVAGLADAEIALGRTIYPADETLHEE